MEYRLPILADEDILAEYVREHYLHQENSISASLGLIESDFDDWVEKINRNATIGDCEWGKSLLYLCFDQQMLIGLLSIRYNLPKELSKKYGDIGYGVRPTKRNKGYATAMLKYALSVCKEKGLTEVVLGCYKDNVASSATIKKNGGVLFGEEDGYKKGKVSAYYLIKL
ncbi:MAG: GNAT family N-acetyltransferase [Clostridia bacterium]|nr:GNAT family N-acetyltransferase [Clostridia bacterium]